MAMTKIMHLQQFYSRDPLILKYKCTSIKTDILNETPTSLLTFIPNKKEKKNPI